MVTSGVISGVGCGVTSGVSCGVNFDILTKKPYPIPGAFNILHFLTKTWKTVVFCTFCQNDQKPYLIPEGFADFASFDTTGPTCGQDGQEWPKPLSKPRGFCEKLLVFHEILVKIDTFLGVRFVGDILEKMAENTVFHVFILKLSEIHQSPWENLTFSEQWKTSGKPVVSGKPLILVIFVKNVKNGTFGKSYED